MPQWIKRTLTAPRRLTAATRERLGTLRIGPHIFLMIVTAIALTFGIGWLFGIQLPTSADQAAKPFEGIKLVLAVVAGIGGIVALTVAYRKQRLGETTERRLEAAEAHARGISDSNEAREQAKHFHERFSAATEQLGSEQANIRSAGAYALAHLADDWNDGRQTCINVLCNYIRMPYTSPQELDDNATPEVLARNELRQQERQVRHTILAIIGERLRTEPVPGKTWHSYKYDFTGAVIDGGDFRDAKFTGGTVYFRAAKFKAGFVDFGCARFTGGIVSFLDAEFTGGTVYFGDAEFTRGTVSFRVAKFTGGTVYFRDAKFTGGTVNFRGAKFTGGTTDFSRTRFQAGIVEFSGAKFTGGTVDFRLASAWSKTPVFDDFPDGPPQGLLLPLG